MDMVDACSAASCSSVRQSSEASANRSLDAATMAILAFARAFPPHWYNRLPGARRPTVRHVGFRDVVSCHIGTAFDVRNIPLRVPLLHSSRARCRLPSLTFGTPTGTDLRNAQEDDFRRVMAEMSSEVPLVCVCGNHDIGNEPTPESVRSYRDTFGDDYFVFWCGGVMCIVINSQYYENSTHVSPLRLLRTSAVPATIRSAACPHRT